jgi:hypothetical protein
MSVRTNPDTMAKTHDSVAKTRKAVPRLSLVVMYRVTPDCENPMINCAAQRQDTTAKA